MSDEQEPDESEPVGQTTSEPVQAQPEEKSGAMHWFRRVPVWAWCVCIALILAGTFLCIRAMNRPVAYVSEAGTIYDAGRLSSVEPNDPDAG